MIRAAKRSHGNSFAHQGDTARHLDAIDEDFISQEMKRIRILANSPGEIRLEKELTSLPKRNCFSVGRTANKSVVQLWCHIQHCLTNAVVIPISFEFEITISKYYPHNCPMVMFKCVTSNNSLIGDILPHINRAIYSIFDQQSNLLTKHPVVANWSALCSLLTIVESLVEFLEHL